jgi:hypothetical protein
VESLGTVFDKGAWLARAPDIGQRHINTAFWGCNDFVSLAVNDFDLREARTVLFQGLRIGFWMVLQAELYPASK